ncbi:MAG: hypothetical protein ACOY31_09535 [Bacillota bacterium]
MNYDKEGQVGELLEGLVQKLELLNREKKEEYEKSVRAMASLDKLDQALVRLEYRKKREKEVAQRISRIYKRLEGARDDVDGDYEDRDINDIVIGILNGVKTAGQIIEVVASSLQVMVDTVSGVLKSQKGGPRGQAEEAGGDNGIDLLSLLKPVNAILNTLTANNKAEKIVEPKTKEDMQESTGEPTAADPENEVPVVKAVPVDSNGNREDG